MVPEKADILDICSSWISHLPEPEGTPPREDPRLGRPPMPIGSLYGRVEGLGMNERELQSNRQLTGYVCARLVPLVGPMGPWPRSRPHGPMGPMENLAHTGQWDQWV